MTDESIFEAALGKAPGPERQAFLDEACGGDATRRARIEELLAADEYAAGVLERGPESGGDTAPPAPLAADRLFAGRFKLRQKIGEGGMGEVWVADQAAPVQRRVALKVIRPALATDRLLARFDQERQALALMDHPNIAKVLDAGEDEVGRPYFVMELIKGVPITKYCDEARLTTPQRLELFLPVCQAVQHAHQKGVIHRDLKPSNILVALYDGRPIPKVIDFGVAKATGPRLTEQSVYTEVGSLIGTLEYMSPEQAELNNLDIDTRSDVYTLGVVLYELLTGSVPFSRKELQAAAFTEMLRMIKEVEPPRPSTKLSGSGTLPSVAAVRQTDPRRLVALVRGELDWVVMRCLEKDRGRRYQTASGLAHDLERYLADEVVEARPPSAGYRLRKFVRRHRGPVLAAGLLLLALVGGVVGTGIGLVRADQARRAEQDRAEGERQAKETAEKRLAQIEKGVDILGSIFQDLDPNAEEKEGRPLRMILGDRLDQAAAALEGEAVADPLVVARLQVRLGQSYLGLGHAAQAEALFVKAVATRAAHLGANDRLTLAARHDLALAIEAAGRPLEAIPLFQKVRDAQAAVLGADHADTLTTLNHLAGSLWRIGKPKEAVPLLEQVRDGRVRQFGADDNRTLVTLKELAGAYVSAGRKAEGIALAEKVWAARVRKHGEAHALSIDAMTHLAYAYQAGYKMKQSLALFEKARDIAVPSLGPAHPRTLMVLHDLAHLYRAYGRTAEAIVLFEQVREAKMMVFGGNHPTTLHTLSHLARAYLDAGQVDKALPLAEQAAAGLERLRFADIEAGLIVLTVCDCYVRLGRHDRAEVWRRKWLAVVREKEGPDSVKYARELVELGANLLAQKRYAEAEPVLRDCLAVRRAKQPGTADVFWTQSLLGAALLGQQKYADAEPLLLQAYEGLSQSAKSPEQRHHGLATPGHLATARERLVQLYDAWGQPAEAAKWRQAAEPAAKPAAGP